MQHHPIPLAVRQPRQVVDADDVHRWASSITRPPAAAAPVAAEKRRIDRQSDPHPNTLRQVDRQRRAIAYIHQRTEVARAEPAVLEGGRRGLRLAHVAFGHRRRAQSDDLDLAVRQLASVQAEDAQVDAGDNRPIPDSSRSPQMPLTSLVPYPLLTTEPNTCRTRRRSCGVTNPPAVASCTALGVTQRGDNSSIHCDSRIGSAHTCVNTMPGTWCAGTDSTAAPGRRQAQVRLNAAFMISGPSSSRRESAV
jgi:hypothetical protein